MSIFQVKNHIVCCGDSTNKDVVEMALYGLTWDVCIFDPPYEKTELYLHIPDESDRKLLLFWDFKRFAIAPHNAILKGWVPQYEMIWDCCQQWKVENVPYLRHKTCGFFHNKPLFDAKEGKIERDGKESFLTTVERFPITQTSKKNGQYSKPFQWIKAILSGVKGTVFLDMFGGNGTIAKVCETISKASVTIEIDASKCEKIVSDLEMQTGVKRLLL